MISEKMSLESLKKLNNDSLKLDKLLVEINCLLDNCQSSINGMSDVAEKMTMAFKLYRELVEDMHKTL